MPERTKPIVHQMTTGLWAVVDAPNDWQDGDRYPLTNHREFSTEAEAIAERNRRLSQPSPDDADA
jgi:hypothetical protein